MPLYTADKLRRELLNPLTVLLSEFSTAIAEMVELDEKGKIPNGELFLSISNGIAAVGALQSARDEIQVKINAAQENRLEKMERRRIAMQQRRKGDTVGNKKRK